jgi:uncharacterized coiled-coil DUF342 family protein
MCSDSVESLPGAEGAAMNEQGKMQQLNDRVSELMERRLELNHRIEDCERYLQVADGLISTEEQQRTAFDIQDYRQELETLTAQVAVLRDQL